MKRSKYFVTSLLILWSLFSCSKETTSPNNGLMNPSNLVIILIENDLIKLNWDDNSTVETTFCIDRKKGENDWLINYNEVAENITTFNDYIPTNIDTVYSYRVRASDGNDYSNYSNDVGWYSSNSAPSNLLLEQITQDSIKINWQDNSVGEEGFSLNRKIGEEEWIIDYALTEPNETQFTDYSNSLNEICYYRISAFSGSSKSLSIYDSVQVMLPAPTNLTSTVNDNIVELNWSDNSYSELGFIIERKTFNSEFSFLSEVSENVTEFLDETIENNTVYTYRIYAFENDFNSNYSNEAIANVFYDYILIPEDYSDIQTAINNSFDGNTILVSPGIYYENINFIGKDISVISYFTIFNDRDYIEQTIIDGNFNGCCVKFISGESDNTTLQGFTITNGVGDDYIRAGGISCENNSNPNLLDLIVIGNAAYYTTYGGGIRSISSNPYIRNVIISENAEGGFYCYDNYDIIMENVIITGNYDGAALYCNFSSMLLQNVTIANNTFTPHDIWCDCSDMMVINCIIRDQINVTQYYSYPSHMTIMYSDIVFGENSINTHNNGTYDWLVGNISEDPLFTDDYELQGNSPCIDAGNPDSQYNDPDGSRNDMGAYGGPNGEW